MLSCDALMGLTAMQNVLLIAPNTQLGVNFKVGAAELMLVFLQLPFYAVNVEYNLTEDRRNLVGKT